MEKKTRTLLMIATANATEEFLVRKRPLYEVGFSYPRLRFCGCFLNYFLGRGSIGDVGIYY